MRGCRLSGTVFQRKRVFGQVAWTDATNLGSCFVTRMSGCNLYELWDWHMDPVPLHPPALAGQWSSIWATPQSQDPAVYRMSGAGLEVRTVETGIQTAFFWSI
jgi:hypothetical protein